MTIARADFRDPDVCRGLAATPAARRRPAPARAPTSPATTGGAASCRAMPSSGPTARDRAWSPHPSVIIGNKQSVMVGPGRVRRLRARAWCRSTIRARRTRRAAPCSMACRIAIDACPRPRGIAHATEARSASLQPHAGFGRCVRHAAAWRCGASRTSRPVSCSASMKSANH